MKYKNLLLFGLVFIFLISSFYQVNAAFDTMKNGIVAAWKFDETTGTRLNASNNASRYLNVSASIATWTKIGKIGNALNLSLINLTSRSARYLANPQWTFNFWIKRTNSAPESFISVNYNPNPNYSGFDFYKEHAGYGVYGFLAKTSSPYYQELKPNPKASAWSYTNTWDMITIMFSGTNITYYKNNILQNATRGLSTMKFNVSWDDFKFGKATGVWDELYFWNRTLTPTERYKLYNNFSQYPFIIADVNFTIGSKNIYDNSTIYSFSVKIQNGSTIKTYYTSTGNITKILNSDIRKYNITFYNWSGFNRTYLNYDFQTSGSLYSKLKQTNITFNIRFHDTNRLINFSNITIYDFNKTKTFYTKTGILNFNPKSQNFKFKFSDDNFIFLTKNQTFTFTARQNKTFNITVNDTENRIRFIDKKNNSGIFDANITIIYPDGSIVYKITNLTGWVKFSSNYNGLFQFGTYNLSFNKNTFLETNFNIILNHSNIPKTQTYNISRTFINFTFRNSQTNSLINNISVDIYSNSFSKNYSTASKNYLYIDLLEPEEYTVKFYKNGYDTNYYHFIASSLTADNITLYLYNSSATTEVNTFVYDQNNKLTPNVLIKCLKYDILTNSYILEQMRYTNVVGQAQFNLILGTEFYKFILEYPIGNILSEPLPSLIYETTINFQINIVNPVAQNFYDSLNVDGYVDYNNITKNFLFTYTDSESKVSKGCFYIYDYSSGTEILVNSSCVSSTSASIVLYAINTTGKKYVAKGFITLDGKPYLFDSIIHEYILLPDFGKSGLFFTALFIIIIVTMFYNYISLAISLAGLPIIIMSSLGLIKLALGYALGIEILLIVFAVWVSQWQR